VTPTVLHLFAGAGGGALGFHRAGFTTVGAVDVDATELDNLQRLVGVTGTQADLLEMSPGELRSACSTSPDVVFTSPPCKGHSACLPGAVACTDKYQAMNSLAFRGVWLALEAWPARPPRLIVMENVPRITTRGAGWLEDVRKLLGAYGYVVHESTHDCGELGGLAQRRRRYLLVARHRASVQEWLYRPPLRRVRGIGEVVGPLPLPGTGGGPMHRLPRLAALNWLRLALIPAGRDWRALPEVVRLSPRAGRINGGFGVEDWTGPAHAVVGEGTVRNTWSSVADPRLDCAPRAGVLGVLDEGPAGAVVGAARPDNGAFSIADPRLTHEPRRGSSGVQDWAAPSPTVLGVATRDKGASVADPRVTCDRREGSLGVTAWDRPSTTVIGRGIIQNGPWQVADPRGLAVPTHELAVDEDGVPRLVGPPVDIEDKRPCHLVIRALDGTWHRPLTTLELAVLQSFPSDFVFGGSQARQRVSIGNAVPPAAAEAIARSCLATLRAAAEGGLLLAGEPVWVAPEARP